MLICYPSFVLVVVSYILMVTDVNQCLLVMLACYYCMQEDSEFHLSLSSHLA